MIRKVQNFWLYRAPLWMWAPVNRLGKQLAKVGYKLGRKAPCPEITVLPTPTDRWGSVARCARCVYYSGHPGRCRWTEETR